MSDSMSESRQPGLRDRAARLHEDDVVRVLVEQHERIQRLFAQLFGADGRGVRNQTFRELRELLVVHETVEQLVLRPVSEPLTAPGLAERRMLEEKEAAILLAGLEDIDVCCEEFDDRLAELASVVLGHARTEEVEEFGPVIEQCTPAERIAMGRRVKAAERLAPVHVVPATTGSTGQPNVPGPVTAVIERVRDVIGQRVRTAD